MRAAIVTVLVALTASACGSPSGTVSGGSAGLGTEGPEATSAATTTVGPSASPSISPTAEGPSEEAAESPTASADEGAPAGTTSTDEGASTDTSQPAPAADDEVDPRIPNVSLYEPSSGVEQAVVVRGASWSSTVVTVETWERDDASSPWTLVGTGDGRVGYNGMKINRQHGDGSTPAGMFRIPWGFGTRSNPNSRGMTWRTFDDDDYWVGDQQHAPSYNTFQTSATSGWRTAEAEWLWGFRTLYEYAWVIDFNRPRYGTRPASEPQPILSGPGSGNAIFLHVQGTGATAGCVSVPRSRLQSISAWFDESKNPVIIIGEDDWLRG